MRRAGVLGVLVLGLAYASIPQGGGWGQNAHFGTVQALAEGHAYINRFQTGDVAYYHGRYYSTKAPGLALLAVGPYYVLNKIDAGSLVAHVPGVTDSTDGILWLLTIIGCAVPAAIAVFVMRRIGDEVSPGLGAAAALTIGLGTLVLPFATVFFDHALSASLGFIAFALLWWGRSRLRLCACAGLLAGYAVTSEYPLALVAIGLGLYTLLTAPAGARLRRAIVYSAGVVVGMIPIVVFNWLVFGSPTHLTYADAVSSAGASGHDVLGLNVRGFFGVSWPNFEVAMNLLFANVGLLTVAPVVAVAFAGLLLLYRRGHRAEALLIGLLSVTFVIYNAGYETPFGGASPGPRFLVAILPFLAVPLALAYRAWPLTTVALAVPSVAMLIGITATSPTLNFDGSWYKRIEDGSFSGRGVGAIVPFALLAIASIVLGVLATRLRGFDARDAFGAAVAVGGWLLIAFEGWTLLQRREPGYTGLLALAVVAVVVLAHRGRFPRIRRQLEAA